MKTVMESPCRPRNGVRRRSPATLLVATLALAAAGAAPAMAGDQPEAVPQQGNFTAAVMPLGLKQPAALVIVQISGDPVAVVQGNSGRKLSRQEKDQIKATLKAREDGLKTQIEALGGTVLSSYQVVYNGIKVRIDRQQVPALKSLSGVIGVRPVEIFERQNVRGVPLIGAPAAWQGVAGVHGEGIKIAVIDTGIDYTHANFGGPGTQAAFLAADATDTLPADPSLFGPAAPKVKGGIDLVGDDYSAGDPDHDTPVPDPNPLDCNGHGSHVAGTATGFGVLSDGTRYTGSYDASTFTSNSFRIGPGVAPLADLYAVRVFGCSGSTGVVIDALEWAVDNDMDVVNMSLGSPFGQADSASAEASSNAAKAGVVVVAAAGNEGANQYITGSPAAATRAISVAAMDAIASFPGATMVLSTGKTVVAENSNGATLPGGPLTVAVLRDSYPSGNVSLGCAPADYTGYPGGVAGKLVVTLRGTCARVARAVFGQQASAAAVAMINTDAGYPPFEGQITSNPDTGEQYTVTIPFLGVRGVLGPAATADGDNLVAADPGTADPGTATLTATTITNPNFSSFASFSSSGPRTGDSWLKPDVTAPGVSVISTAVGTGANATILSGTSMASPIVAGLAALVRQSHPGWTKVEDLKAAIVNTGDPAGIGGPRPYRTSRGGTGLVQAPPAVKTSVVALGDTGTSTLNFGFEEFKTDYSKTRQIHLRNRGASDATFNASIIRASGQPHTVTLGASQVIVPAGGEQTLDVTLAVPAATAGSSSGSGLSFREVAGLVQLAPTGGQNAGVTLRVPYYLVPRAQSSLATKLAAKPKPAAPSTVATVTNADGAISGNADFYAWGLADGKDGGAASNDIRAVGVQSFPNPSGDDPNRRLLVFAINTYNRWSNPSVNEFDTYIDVDNDGTFDYVAVAVDQGLIQTGTFNGRMVAAVFSLNSENFSLLFFATAPTDSSTILVPVGTDQLCRKGEPCLSVDNPRLTYATVGFNFFGGDDDVADGTATFNAWSSSISQGAFLTVPPGGTASTPISVNPAEWSLTPAKGVMVITLDNKSGASEAQLIDVPF
jgi:minor extracellular serine protease Vpr